MTMTLLGAGNVAPPVRQSAWPLVVAGAVAGLTWAAALRGWMIQMAGDSSAFQWVGTSALILTPGLLVGGLIGLAEHRRRTGGPPGHARAPLPLALRRRPRPPPPPLPRAARRSGRRGPPRRRGPCRRGGA